MKINKRFITIVGLGFTVVGLAVTFLGFAMTGFSLEAYDNNARNRPWYQTFQFNTNEDFGISFDDDDDDFFDDFGD